MRLMHSIQKNSTRFCGIFLILLRCTTGFTFQSPLSVPSFQRRYSHILQQGLFLHRQNQLQQRRKTELKQAMSSNNNNSNNGPVSLKSAALPLLDSGKAFARTGELLIDITTTMDMYGGALSAAGANIRNAGDNIAQAAASCRFKTAQELVIDEIREASSALLECTNKLQQAVDEANTDQNEALATCIEQMIPHIKGCSTALEMTGAALLQRQALSVCGKNLIVVGQEISSFASILEALPPPKNQASATAPIINEAVQRCQYAATQMMLAGMNLSPSDATNNKTPTNGKSWLKGGM